MKIKNNFYADGKRKNHHNTKLDEFIKDLGTGEIETKYDQHAIGIADEDEAIYIYRSPKTYILVEKMSLFWIVTKVTVSKVDKKSKLKVIDRIYFGEDRATALSTVRKLNRI